MQLKDSEYIDQTSFNSIHAESTELIVNCQLSIVICQLSIIN